MFLKHVRKTCMNVNILKLIGLHEFVDCFNSACYIMYCYLTVYACVNGWPIENHDVNVTWSPSQNKAFFLTYINLYHVVL